MDSTGPSGASPLSALRLGLGANWRQFALLVLVNAFVGGMVGLERSVLPLLAEEEFGLSSHTAILSFIVSFGAVKALANLFAGVLGDRLGRKPVLIAGWLAGLPVPFLLMAAPDWGWVIAANLLLGVNQGLAWSTTVIMKIDLVGPSRRGLAMGLNEAAGYGAVSLAALAAGYVASVSALRPQPFYLGVVFALAGLALSVFFVRETKGHAGQEARALDPGTAAVAAEGSRPSFAHVLLLTSWKDRALFSVSQAGFVNNLNDGMAWGLLPLFFKDAGLDVGQI
ncbi:MAG: MFS transporter, partial [Chloroflexota bacterium]